KRHVARGQGGKLSALPTVGAGNVSVTGTGPFTVTFQGALAGAAQNLIAVAVDQTLTTAGTAQPTNTRPPGPAGRQRPPVGGPAGGGAAGGRAPTRPRGARGAAAGPWRCRRASWGPTGRPARSTPRCPPAAASAGAPAATRAPPATPRSSKGPMTLTTSPSAP